MLLFDTLRRLWICAAIAGPPASEMASLALSSSTLEGLSSLGKSFEVATCCDEPSWFETRLRLFAGKFTVVFSVGLDNLPLGLD